MDELILHHYPLSSFSEKARRMLAFKGIPWRSVEQPMIMPKPKLLPLTGGYRRVPVLQITADVYCDTSLIARKLDELRPEPPLLPPDLAAVAASSPIGPTTASSYGRCYRYSWVCSPRCRPSFSPIVKR